MNRASSSPVREGDVIGGKYRVERVLGAGGMGVVVAAVHLVLQERVAIKFLLSDVVASEDVRARFLREAQAAARIRSEHVARVLDVAALENGVPYMVLELLEGSDLARTLLERGPLPVAEAVGWVLEACVGIAEAHAVGVIHRDLKPSNLFVSRGAGGRTTIKVLDFGISKLVSPASGDDASMTKTSAMLGSPLYMSPEQMTSAKHVDARTDIWSLGVSLFELLAGRPPFTGDSMAEVVASVLQGTAPDVRTLRPDVPGGLAKAIATSLEKDRERRYPTIAELAAAIAPFGPRHADLSVERIAQVLGKSPPGSVELARTAPEAPLGGRGVRTTATPVSHEPPSSIPAAPKRNALWIAAPVAGVALLGIGALASRWLTPPPTIGPALDATPANMPLVPGATSAAGPADAGTLLVESPRADGGVATDAGSAVTPPIVGPAPTHPVRPPTPPSQNPWDRRR